MELRRICSILLVCAVAGSAIAVPARRDGMTRTNAEGKQITVFQHGDETFHYMTDGEGNWLDEQTLLPISTEEKTARQQQGAARVQTRRVQQAMNLPRLLAPRGAVILVSFQDKEFAHSHELLTEWASGDEYSYNGATGSIRQYFLDQSWGEYEMLIDIYGPVTVSKNYSYYGANKSNGSDKHPDEMVKEACILAHDSCGADFSQYDVNNDGKVDWVVVLYAGMGEANGGDANTIWPHQYELSYTGMSFKLDGKKVDHYCCLNEIDGQSGELDGIGTFCHEFSHIMGLPDLYYTGSGTSPHTLCQWDILDYGPYNNNGNTPPNYSAYERWFMGWLTPRVLTDPEYITLNPMVDTHEALLMCEGDEHDLNPLNPSPKNFYLIENRRKEGWDKFLPGKGMLLTKIQFDYDNWRYNEVNNDKNNQGVDLIEAKANTSSGYSMTGKSTDAFPAGAANYTAFENHEITNIKLNNGVINFSYRYGTQGVEDVEDGKTAIKRIENGRVLIIRDGKTYDILGNRL